MSTPPVRVERRAGQRFSFLLPVSLRESSTGIEGLGFSLDLSARGIFFFTNAALREGAKVELTLSMPSEITLAETMRVRCRGQVLRVVKRLDPGVPQVPAPAGMQIGAAVRFEGYEYISECTDGTAAFQRIASLRDNHDDDEAMLQKPAHIPSVVT